MDAGENSRAPSPPGTSETDGMERQLSWALPELPSAVSSSYTWGRSDLGQTGSGRDQNTTAPELLQALQGKDVVHAAGASYNSAFITRDGELYTTGSNDAGQLGVKGREGVLEPVRVSALEMHNVHAVACGQGHMVAIVDNGSLAAWGSNEYGQLGNGEEGSNAAQPRVLRSIRGAHFARVAAGATTHSLALTSSGQVYSFGEGSFGALGHGDVNNRSRPTMVQALWPEGIVSIAAGEYFSAAVSLSGRVFTWGRNKYGQLGNGGFGNAFIPQPVPGISDAIQVACGDHHCIALTRWGEVYTWGAHSQGQVGQGSIPDLEAVNGCLCSPKKVEALASHFIRQVSAGAQHSFFLGPRDELWGSGANDEGQLALLSASCVALPTRIPGLPGLPLRFTVAAGDHSIAVVEETSPQNGGLHRHSSGPCRRSCMMTLQMPPDLLHYAELATGPNASRREVQLLGQAVEDVFSSPAVMLSMFEVQHSLADLMDADADPIAAATEAAAVAETENRGGQAGAQEQDHGLDLQLINALYTALLKVYSTELVTTLGGACSRLLDGLAAHLSAPRPHAGGASPDTSLPTRVIFALLQNPLNADASGIGAQLMSQICVCTAKLTAEQRQALMCWLRALPADQFGARNVRPLQRHISGLARRQGPQDAREALMKALQLLDLMFGANEQLPRRIALNEYYNQALSDSMDVQEEYVTWRRTKGGQDGTKRQRGAPQQGATQLVSLCEVPFVLTPEAKGRIFKFEAAFQMHHQVHSFSVNALLQGVNPQLVQFLDIRIRRERVLEDALNQIVGRPHELKKPLRVTFISQGVEEEGLDQGGVKKEFFQLLTREIFNEAYGMFVFNEETRTYWFNITSIEAETEFTLVGQLMGLAIYNSVILDAHFPHCLYSELLGKQPNFQDLKQAMPELARGLQQLLDFEGDVEATFARNFVVEHDFFGEIRTVELKPGGSNIPVTNDNRQEFVHLISLHYLNTGIVRQLGAFAQGFHSVAGGAALTLLQDEELELLVCGLPHLDFDALEAAARYEGGFSAEHPFIRQFWGIVQSLPLEKKRRLLAFATGSDRAPVGGLGKMTLIIQRSGPDSDRLPTAHTCFNYLLLPEYSSEDKLKSRLLTAIENAQGFGLQ